MHVKSAKVIYLKKIISVKKILCDESNYIHRDGREREKRELTQASTMLCLGIKRQI